MKILIISFLFCLRLYTAQAQNLVTNFDFSTKEPNTGCPASTGFSTDNGHPAGWYTAPFHGYSPDYFHTCGTNGYVPGANARGCEYPLSGTAYVGVLAYLKPPDVTSGSEYFYQQLSQPLTQGQQYYIEFWVSAADDAYYNAFAKHLGMYLTTNLNSLGESGGQGSVNRGLHHLLPQIPNTFPAQNFYTKLNGWQKISGYFTPPSSGFQYIVIGNFDPGINNSTPAPTLQYRTQPGPNDDVAAFYFVDAVTIIPSNQTPPTREPYISGPSDNLICGSGSTYILNNAPVGTTVTWSASPGSLFTNSTGNSSTANLVPSSASASGSATLTFNLTGECGSLQLTKSLWVGEPSITYSPPGLNPCTNSPYYYTYPIDGANYYWEIDNANVWFTVLNGYPSCSVISFQQEMFTLTLTVSTGSCNYTVSLPNEISPGLYCQCFYDPWQCDGQGGGMGFAVYPNPTSEGVNITYEAFLNGEEKSIPNEPVQFELLNTNSEKVYTGYMKEKSVVIPVKGLPKGVYYLNLFNTKGIIQRKIVINN
ncbi:MAG TPA: T9SS type A sorting domain-containing protein [Cyclobacteriaceae bacterium]|nr:T9SS type A sorting domain-containing protein [Cyclobacteriaceae bacterium]HRJ80285.1 T9SS type A sorting domain-containing protein [Cyclobacteriaceae bacterium]